MDDICVQRPWRLAGLPKQTPVLLAYSGGADSTALLYLLLKFAKEDGFSLTLAHVNHGIRGEDAIRDRNFCADTAKRLGLEIRILDADIPASAKVHGCGLEEEARKVRYDFFAKVMQEQQIPILVTAHHADDNLETVLFRLSRGTGLRGLSGIAPERSFANGFLVRPLLRVGKNELLRFCYENRLNFVTDQTNADTQYARNKLRHEVLPVLEELFPGVSARVGEQTEAFRQDEACLTSLAEAFLEKYCDETVLSVDEWNCLHPAIRRRVIGTFLKRVTGEEPLKKTVDDVLEKLDSPKDAWRMSVAKRATLCLQDGLLRIFFASETQKQIWQQPFEIGSFSIGDIIVSVSEISNGDPMKKNTDTAVTLHADAGKNYFWKTVESGDRIFLHGMHKRIVQVWREAGIPVAARNSIPVLSDGEEIVFAPFVGVKKEKGQVIRSISVRFPARFLPAGSSEYENKPQREKQ